MATEARHRILSHTADVGIRAEAGDLATLFAEAAIALGELAADVSPGARETAPQAVELEAPDLVGLAYRWLNELIGLADARRVALCGADVAAIDEVDVPAGSEAARAWSPARRAWRLAGSARFAEFHGRTVRPRLGLKSATYHGLAVERDGAGWTLTAYLDV